jgi:hypothetical protein
MGWRKTTKKGECILKTEKQKKRRRRINEREETDNKISRPSRRHTHTKKGGSPQADKQTTTKAD